MHLLSKSFHWVVAGALIAGAAELPAQTPDTLSAEVKFTYRTIKNNENQALNENITERAKRSRYSIEPHRSTTTTESPRLRTCKTALLRIRWTGVGSRDPGAPLQQLFAGIILVRDHLDEAQAVLLLPQRRLDRGCQLLLALYLHKLPLHPLATVLQL